MANCSKNMIFLSKGKVVKANSSKTMANYSTVVEANCSSQNMDTFSQRKVVGAICNANMANCSKNMVNYSKRKVVEATAARTWTVSARGR